MNKFLNIHVPMKIAKKQNKTFYFENMTDYIDPKITFGVELEANTKERDIWLNLKKISTYTIKKDGSVAKVCEIVSPILHYTEKDLDRLEAICEAMEACDFYTDETCGGHIHVGASYFETTEEFNNFLRLYLNCEKIIYLISNKAGEPARKRIDNYAKKIADSYVKLMKEYPNYFNIPDIEYYKEKLAIAVNERYYGLNFKNLKKGGIGTIEFRMPNGQINYTELNANIKLFVLLVQRSKELTYLSDDTFIKSYINELQNETISDEDKLEILLGILFQNNEKEKEIYRERFNKNKHLRYGHFSNEHILIKK